MLRLWGAESNVGVCEPGHLPLLVVLWAASLSWGPLVAGAISDLGYVVGGSFEADAMWRQQNVS